MTVRARALVRDRIVAAPRPFDLERSFAMQRFGLYDPTAKLEATPKTQRLRKAFATPRGTCVVDISTSRDAPGAATIEASGADEADVCRDLADALAADDGYESFAPTHPLLAKLHHVHAGLRLVRVPWLFDVAACTILQQRVTVREAVQQWQRITMRYGEVAGDLRVFPSVLTVARMASWRFEELGVDPKRTRALLALARDVHRRDLFTTRAEPERVRKTMMTVRGIGPWTTESTLGFAFGDPDAVPLADLHLPHLVTWALARERPGSDVRMLELLEPYRGHRFRAIRLLMNAGISVPRV